MLHIDEKLGERAYMSGENLSRRRFLLSSIGLAGAAIAVAACGGQASTPPVATTAPAAAASQPTATTAAAAASGATPTAAAQPAASGGSQILLNGAGSTFDNPLFSKAFSEYTKANPNVQVNYQSVGSGAGIQQLTKGTVDFGASDAPMTDDQISQAGGDILHIPITLGAAAVGYNLPGINDGLKLSGDALAKIYMGTITAWNDPAIVALNGDLKLPDTPIAVVHRSDGSGTTDIFTTYLSAVSADWKSKVGNGTAVNWPAGVGGKGSEGVAGQVKQTPGGIGYFELAYAKQNNITSAAIDNGSKTYISPSADGASACAAGVAGNMPADLRIRIAGCTGAGVYPISGFSWVVLHQKQTDQAKGAALANLMAWMIQTGQTFSAALFYAPLPSQVVTLDQEKLKSMSYNGQPLLKS
jgi:phosphate transport system substrate-binding protein